MPLSQRATHHLTFLFSQNFFPERARILWIGDKYVESRRHFFSGLRIPMDCLISHFPLAGEDTAREILLHLDERRYETILFQQPPLCVTLKQGKICGVAPLPLGLSRQDRETLREELTRALRILQSRTKRIIVASSLPAACDRERSIDQEGLVEAWNQLLKEIAAELGYPFLDFYALGKKLLQPKGGSIDIAAEAYARLSGLLKKHFPSLRGKAWWLSHCKWFYTVHKRQWRKRLAIMQNRPEQLPAKRRFIAENDFVTLMRPLPQRARILLIGGSVFRFLRKPLSAELSAPIELFSSSLLPPDPSYRRSLMRFMNPDGYDVILFSYGSHLADRAFPPDFDEFAQGYRRVADMLKERCLHLVPATSPSIMRPDDLHTVNATAEAILLRGNDLVNQYAREARLPLADQHSWMQGQSYVDPTHFTPESCQYQAEKWSSFLRPLLRREVEQSS